MDTEGPSGTSMGGEIAPENSGTGNGTGNGKRLWLGPLALLGFVLLKAKVLLTALSFANLGSLLFSFSTMFLSFGAYGIAYGWSFGAMFVLLILVHELGHYVSMRLAKLDPGLPVFVPFLGAWVKMSKLPENEALNAWVALAGPLFGGLFAIILVFLGYFSKNSFLVASGNVGCILNLFQLLPTRPLDGGFIAPVLGKWQLLLGLLALFLLALILQAPMLSLIALVGIWPLILAFRQSQKGLMRMKPASPVARFWLGLGFFGTAVLLGFFAAQSQPN